MKINKIVLATICAAVLAGSANAAQDYYLYGSTAYRKATFTALQNLFNQTGNTLVDAWGETSAGKYENIAAVAAFTEAMPAPGLLGGTLANQGLGAVTIHGTWAGSVGGEARLTHNDALANTFITDVGAVAGNAVKLAGGRPLACSFASRMRQSARRDALCRPDTGLLRGP